MKFIKIVRIITLGLLTISALAIFAIAATNTVNPSVAGQNDSSIDVNALKPDVCAGIILSGTINVVDDGNNLILGTAGKDNLNGQGGDDCIIGGGGDDIIQGGAGNDVLVSDGDGMLNGGQGTDTCIGPAKKNNCEN